MTEDEKARYKLVCHARNTAMIHMGTGDGYADAVNQRRIAWARHRDEMLAFQKECGQRRDVDGAKFFKAEATEAMKRYRGACLVMGWVGISGDSPWLRFDDWPSEIIPFATSEMMAADYGLELSA